LTALYGGLLLVAMALVLGASYWLVGRHLDRTLPPADADAALQALGLQYGLALAGATLLAAGVGWLFAGRQLAPMARAFAAQERFVANASHELRSPLTVIRTEAEVALADPAAGPGELREMGTVVVEAADRSGSLITAEVAADLGREIGAVPGPVSSWRSKGTNALLRDGEKIYRTYFVNDRGDEAMGSTWSYLDLTALGRQEEWEDSPEGYPQTPPYQWWNRHDEYDEPPSEADADAHAEQIERYHSTQRGSTSSGS
jgi:hypothetical protein